MAKTPDQPDQEWLVNQIAHVLRNPLFAAQVQTEAILFKARSLPDFSRPAELLHSQLERFGSLIEEMLLFGRPVEPSLAPADVLYLMNTAVANAVATESPQVEPKLSVEVDPSGLSATWDSKLVSIALERIISNVIVHTEAPHEASIQVRAEGESISISVVDSGPGFAPDMLEKATRPFFPQHRGRPGLGLSIAQKMVHAHGGEMRLESSPQGATIRLTIPSG
jgi:signal transduction histidine kinase